MEQGPLASHPLLMVAFHQRSTGMCREINAAGYDIDMVLWPARPKPARPGGDPQSSAVLAVSVGERSRVGEPDRGSGAVPEDGPAGRQ